MKKKTDPNRQLHLLTDDEKPSPASKQEIDTLVGQGVLRYEELRIEVDRALFATPQDIETLKELMPQLQLLRERLASYGVHVRP